MHTSEVFIGGEWRPPASGETYATINPATEEVSAQVARGDERDVDLAVQLLVAPLRQGEGQAATTVGRRGQLDLLLLSRSLFGAVVDEAGQLV